MTTLPLFTSCGFNSSTKYEHIYVPSNLVDTYKVVDGWKTYASIIEANTCINLIKIDELI